MMSISLPAKCGLLPDNHVYATYRHLTLGGNAELSYILGKDSMTLISIVGDFSLVNSLATLDHFPSSTLLFNFWADVESPIPGPAGAQDVGAKLDANLVAVFGEDNDGIPRSYWVRTKDGLVIKPNFTPASDIVFAGSVPGLNGGLEEFYFYSLKEQTVTFQKGSGMNATQAQTVTFPTEFSKLVNMVYFDGRMFALSDTGFVLRLTSSGMFTLEAVNQTWIASLRSNSEPWWSTLQTIAETHGAITVPVLGLTDSNTKASVPVWYFHGKFVVVSSTVLNGKQIQIPGLTPSGSSAWVTYSENDGLGHLYTQPLVSNDNLHTIFSPSSPTVDLSGVAVAQLLSPFKDSPFKNVVMTDSGLQYTADDGRIFIVGETTTTLLYGVDQSWQAANSSTLEATLAQMAEQSGDHGEVFVLQGAPSDPPAWYSISLGKVVRPVNDGTTWADQPLWLGVNVDGTMGYFFVAGQSLVDEGSICGVILSNGTTARISGISLAKRFKDVLLIELTPESAFEYLPPIWSVRDVMVSQNTGGLMTLTIPQASWDYYESIVLQDKNLNGTQGPDILFLNVANPGALLTKKIDEDLVVIDISNGHSLTIRKAFGADSAYSNVAVRTSLAVDVTVQTMASAQRWIQQAGSLNAPLDVTLQTICDAHFNSAT